MDIRKRHLNFDSGYEEIRLEAEIRLQNTYEEFAEIN